MIEFRRIKIFTTMLTIVGIILLQSCTFNDFSNEYTGNVVYSVNSNKIHRPKCGEAQKIKEKNYVVSTKSVIELINEGYKPCKVCLYYYSHKIDAEESIINNKFSDDALINALNNVGISFNSYNNYCDLLKSEFDFSPNNEKNNNIVKILADLYIGILISKKDYYASNIEYHKIIASIVYRDDNSTYSMFDWALVARLYFNKYDLKSKVMMYLKNVNDDIDKIYGEGCFEHLYDSICEQHNLADANINKNDFEHLSAVICALSNQNYVFNSIVTYSQNFNGVDDIAAQAGYIGDICGTNWKKPSINEADYKADLDAVNLHSIYKNNNGSIYDILSKYYLNIDTNKVNRADEFNNNIGVNTLAKYRNEYSQFLLNIYHDKTIEYMNRINYYDNFMWHIVNKEQNFTPYKYRFYTEYIGVNNDELNNAIKQSYDEWEEIYDDIFN